MFFLCKFKCDCDQTLVTFSVDDYSFIVNVLTPNSLLFCKFNLLFSIFQINMVRNHTNSRFHIYFCECRAVPFRGKQWATHSKSYPLHSMTKRVIACLHDLKAIPFQSSQSRLHKFYSAHKNCSTGKVNSKRAQTFFGTVFTEEFMRSIAEKSKQSQFDIEYSDVEEYEDYEENEENDEYEGRTKMNENDDHEERWRELVGPQLMSEVEEEMKRMTSTEKEAVEVAELTKAAEEAEEAEKEVDNDSLLEVLMAPNPQIEQPMDILEAAWNHATKSAEATAEEKAAEDYFIPGHGMKAASNLMLKDRCSRLEADKKSLVQDIERLSGKLEIWEKRAEEMHKREKIINEGEELLKTTGRVLREERANLDRQQKAVRELDTKYQEKNEIDEEEAGGNSKKGRGC